MNNLVIQFADAELGLFRWTLLNEEAESANLNWQFGSESDLPGIAAQHKDPLIILIPQQCVYMAQVELPQKASRQLLSSIEYQVEDQLAQDIESQHFAIGDTSANPVPIVVVEKTIMHRCLSLVQSYGLRLKQVLPELFLCPWSGSGLHLIETYNGYLLRYGDYQGLKCSSQVLPAMLELVNQDIEFDSIAFYGNDDDELNLPALNGIQIENQALNSTALFDSPSIDLQQREFQLSSAWKALGKAWKWVAILFAALLVVGAYNKAIALQALEQELVDVKEQQYQLLKPYLPADTASDANFKKLLVDRIELQQANERAQGFLKLLVEFIQAKSKFKQIEVDRIGYQNKRLNIDISSNQLNDIESLHELVLKSGVSAKLENLNIKPEQISARLVLQGAPDA